MAEDVTAPGLREDSLYRRRFNLEHEEWLVVARAQAGSSSTYTWATAWSNYVRATFDPNRFHCFPGVGTAMDRAYIYVLEHKTLAGARTSTRTTRRLDPWRCASSPRSPTHHLARSM